MKKWNLAIGGNDSGNALPTEVKVAAEQFIEKCRGFGLTIDTAVLEIGGAKTNVLTGQPVHAGAGQ